MEQNRAEKIEFYRQKYVKILIIFEVYHVYNIIMSFVVEKLPFRVAFLSTFIA